MNLSLRFRLTAAVLVFAGIVALLLSVALITLSRNDLRNTTLFHLQLLLEDEQEELLEEMEHAAAHILDALQGNALDSEFLSDQMSQNHINPLFDIQVTDISGQPLAAAGTASTGSGALLPLTANSLLQLQQGELLSVVSADRIELARPIEASETGYIIFVGGSRAELMSQYLAMQSEALATADRRVVFYSFIAVGIVIAVIILGSLAGNQLVRYLTNPILRLRDHARAIGRGQFEDFNIVERTDEIGELAKAIYSMADDLEMQNQSVKFLAFHDPLTGLANRVNFQSQLETKLHEAETHLQSIALLFVDVDDFKEINDSRGHDVGDRALRMIADRLSRSVNAASKQFDHVHLARVGGDEFTVVVGNLENNEQAARLAEDLLKRIAEPIVVDEQLFNISSSIGIAVYPQDGETASSLLNNADAAMYRSKNLGKGTYRFYEPDMNNELFRSSVVKAEFKAALASADQLELRYQPLINLFSGQIIGAEALIRWHHPRLGLLPPDQFIAIVERNEIALPTDLWVLEQALNLLQKLDLSKIPEFAMSINISASNLVRKQFTSSIQKIIGDKEHIVHRIKLEITETFLHNDERQALEALQALRQMGFSVWLDDFGTGYSSLNHLKTFPVEGIKIDQSFISNLAGSEDDRRMVSALLGLAHAFSVQVIAEGIDNQSSLEFLRAHGCRIGQGMMLGEPMSKLDLIDFLKNSGESSQTL